MKHYPAQPDRSALKDTHLSLSLSALKGGEGTQPELPVLPLLPTGEERAGERWGMPFGPRSM